MKLSAPELRLLRLQGQHLLTPAPREAVLADLCGLQAQLYPCALHGCGCAAASCLRRFRRCAPGRCGARCI